MLSASRGDASVGGPRDGRYRQARSPWSENLVVDVTRLFMVLDNVATPSKRGAVIVLIWLVSLEAM